MAGGVEVGIQLEKRAAVTDTERYRRGALAALAVGLLALSTYLHVYQLSAVPGWDPEEGYNLDIAWNLAHGQLRLFSLATAFGQHPPLFYLQLALSIHFFGYDITAIRALAALYALLTDFALLLVGRKLVGTGAALWAMAVYSIAPVMLANTRWGYSYTQLALVGLLCLGAVWKYQLCESREERRRWLITAAVLAGLATLSDYEGVAWVVLVGLTVLIATVHAPRRRWREMAVALAIGLGIPIVGLLACVLLNPAVVLADLGTSLTRSAGGNPLTQLVVLLLNYAQFLSADPWLLFGVVGLFLAPARTRGLLLGTAAILALVILKVRDIGLSLHTVVPLMPLLALGAGVLLELGLRSLYQWLGDWLPEVFGQRRDSLMRVLATLIVFTVVIAPAVMVFLTDMVELQSATFTTRQDALLASPAGAEAVSHYIFAHAHNGDLVLASPGIAWMFDSPSTAPHTEGADILQTLAETGEQVAFYPAGLPGWRWKYPVALSHARYVVVDNILRQLAEPGQLPALSQLLRQVSGWRLVFRSGQYLVYAQDPVPSRVGP